MRHTYGSIHVNGTGKVTIGDFCSIAVGVRVCTYGHNVNWVSTFPFSAPEFAQEWDADDITGHPKSWDIDIGNDVWVGQDALIMADIGNGAVIGAGSVVRTPVPPYSVVTGNPGRVTGKRFTDEQISALERIAWWKWDDEKIREYVGLLSSPDINEFIREVDK